MNKNGNIQKALTFFLVTVIMAVGFFITAPFTVEAASGSVYLVADHHTHQFDAWAIKPGGTAEYQATYWLSHSTDPAGIAIDESSKTLFVTSEFSGGVEMVDATTMTSLGVSPGPSNLAGIAVDDANDIVYAIYRASSQLYVFDWDPVAKTLTLKSGYPINFPNCSGAYSIALDDIRGILWVADTNSGMARAYNVGTWTEETSRSFAPSHRPVDIAVDRIRSLVYTVSMTSGAGTGGGSHLLSKYDLLTGTETTTDIGTQGVAVAVDEITGLVYVTLSPYDPGWSAGRLGVWNTFTAPWTKVQEVSVSGSPAGICIPQEEVVAYNPLGLSKDDGLAEGQCISPGEDITYEICYDNMKNAYDVHNVKIVDELPAEVSFVSATGGGTYNPSTHTVAWDIGTLSAGATQQCLQLTVHVCSSVSPGIKPVSAWIPTWGKPDLDESLAMFKENTDLFEAASAYAYRFDGTTTLETMYPYQEDSTLLKTIRDEGVMVIPTLRDDYGINPGSYLADPEFRETYVSAIVSKVEAMGYDGIDVDFETMAKEDRSAFSNFMSELSASLHARGKLLTTAVMTKTVDFPGWGPVDAMDWALLGGICDKVIVMFYNGEPASTDYVKRVIDYAISVMPKNRIVYAARFDPPGYMSVSLLEEQLDIILAKGIRREIYIWGIWGDDSSLWDVIREKLATAPAPAPGSTVLNYVTVDSDDTPPTTITESNDVCPLPDEIGLDITVAPKPPQDGEYYKVGEDIEFDLTVHNPTDFDAYKVKLTVMEPPEIEIEDGWFATPWSGRKEEDIPAGETRSTTFEAQAVENGENIEVIVTAYGITDLYEAGKIRGTGDCRINIHPEEGPDWSFAVITDSHIGYGIPDYDETGWDDWPGSEPPPEEWSHESTDWLNNVVETIIREKDYYNIEFVVVLGDIADTAERSEFYMAREILNKLNDPDGDPNTDDGIPYIPVIGNHDQWPYIQPTPGALETFDPDARDVPEEYRATYAYGDEWFNDIFWGDGDGIETNKNLINKVLRVRDVDKKESEWIWETSWTGSESHGQRAYLQNRNFSYWEEGKEDEKINIVCLDFNSRMGEPSELRNWQASMYPQTVDYLEDHLEDGETTIILSHHPLMDGGSFPTSGFFEAGTIAKIVYEHDCGGKTYNFAGHTHLSNEDSVNHKEWDWWEGIIEHKAYKVISTEAVNERTSPHNPLSWPLPGQRDYAPLRIVQINGGELDYETLLKPTKEVAIEWPNPIIDYIFGGHSYPEPNEEITFTAHFTSDYGFSTQFDWDFGDGSTASSLWPSVTHNYSEEGDYDVTLTVITKNLVTGEETTQSTTRTVCVRNKHVISSLPPGLNATSLITEEDLTQIPKNTYEPVLIAKEASEETAIGQLGVHFEEANEDIDVSSFVADVDLEEAKSVLYMPSWPAEIEEYKNLYIPSTGVGTVYICLDATSLGEVSSENADVVMNVGEIKDGMMVTTTFYNGREYYLVYSVTGTGGGELTQPLVANAGPDQTVCVIPPATTAMVTLDGSGSYNADGDPLTYNWTWDGNSAYGVNPTVELPLGTTIITLVVNDSKADSEPDTVNITINPKPAATASSNSPVSEGDSIELYGGPDGMASYNWTGPDDWKSPSPNATRPNATTAMAGNYILTVTNEYGCTGTNTTYVEVKASVAPPHGGGGGSPATRYLTVDWNENITREPLYSNDRLKANLLGPSPDGSHSLLLEQGTHAPIVDGKTHYFIVIRELEETPPLPENNIAIVAINVTPAGAVFDRDIFLSLGFNQLPENALNATMAYYDDVNGVWVPLESESGGPSGIAELTLSAPINHFSIYGVLVELGSPPPLAPAHFVASGLSIVSSVERIWEPVTFVTKTGESVTIAANVANDGGQEGTYTVELKLNGKTVDTTIVTLGAGQSQQVSFTLSEMDYGQYEVEVAELSGEFTTSRTITWWLIIVIIVAIGLIIWGVVWGRRRRRAAQEG